MTIRKLAIAIAIAGLVGACGGMRLQDAETASPTGDAFSKALYGEYIALSKAEYGEGDYEDSDVFADRAIAAAAGTPRIPEAVGDRKQTPAAAKALEAARSRLIVAFGQGARADNPAASAKAQAMYECWAQEQEENFQTDHIDACRIAFFTALAEIETKPMARPAPAPAPMAKMAPETYTVYFAFNSAALDSRANGVVARAAAAAKSGKPSGIAVIGHTDRSGTNNYNSELAEKRANAVADALRGAGVSGRLMTIGSLGENAPAVSTPDGTREAGNRRVVITIRY